jgi:hypothetical protein
MSEVRLSRNVDTGSRISVSRNLTGIRGQAGPALLLRTYPSVATLE